jgi:hypothetical protein
MIHTIKTTSSTVQASEARYDVPVAGQETYQNQPPIHAPQAVSRSVVRLRSGLLMARLAVRTLRLDRQAVYT